MHEEPDRFNELTFRILEARDEGEAIAEGHRTGHLTYYQHPLRPTWGA